MSRHVIIIHCKPNPASGNADERTKNIRLIHQLTGCVSQLDTLLDRAQDVLQAPEAFDFVEEVPRLMSEIYFHYLRTGAIRQQLDPAYLTEPLIETLPDVWGIQAEAGDMLDSLSNLFDGESDYGECDDDRDEDPDADEEDGDGEDDSLCSVRIETAECVPDHIIQRIYRNVDAAITCAFSETNCTHQSCPMRNRNSDEAQKQPCQQPSGKCKHCPEYRA